MTDQHREAVEKVYEWAKHELLSTKADRSDEHRCEILRKAVDNAADAGAAHGYAQGCSDTHKEWLEQEAVNAAMLAKVQDALEQWEDYLQACDSCDDSAGHYLLHKVSAILAQGEGGEQAKFEDLYDSDVLIDPCPECGSAEGQQCSYPDPDHPYRGIEVASQVHACRIYSEPATLDLAELRRLLESAFWPEPVADGLRARATINEALALLPKETKPQQMSTSVRVCAQCGVPIQSYVNELCTRCWAAP